LGKTIPNGKLKGGSRWEKRTLRFGLESGREENSSERRKTEAEKEERKTQETRKKLG